MNQALATTSSREVSAVMAENLDDFVTFVIAKQLFGIPVLKVQDILTPDNIASIPLAPPEVRGSINLRGRIVTVIDVRVRLGLERREVQLRVAPKLSDINEEEIDDELAAEANADQHDELADDVENGHAEENAEAQNDAKPEKDRRQGHMMGVTVEHRSELYTLLVDSVGDVISLSKDFYEGNPSTLDPIWRKFASGVYRLDGRLMVVLDIDRLLNLSGEEEAD